MIVNCKASIWGIRPDEEQYRLTKKKLQSMPKGKQFDFNEMHIFGKFDLFCRRIIKLIDMFSTIDQFKSLSNNKLEGAAPASVSAGADSTR
ncbi:dynein light chain binding protein [Aureococcus anophagefferens]|nr:dynein light chain binding protein [Aureococcus anophagefferens]